MKLGLLTALYADRPLEAVLDIARTAGLDCVEIGAGNYPGTAHCDVAALLSSASRRKEYLNTFRARGLEISALSCHGNPLHPRAEVAAASHKVYRRAVELAEKLAVPCVNLFSGCPGDSLRSRYPNWVTCAWPTDFQEVLEWQWQKRVLPYWRREAAFAARHHVLLGFEMHPGFVVYNPATLLRLREACGEVVVAMLGYAFMGKAHVNAFKKLPYIAYPPPAVPRLVAIAGRDEEAVREAAQRYGFATYYTDWRRLIADPAVQLLDNGGSNDV